MKTEHNPTKASDPAFNTLTRQRDGYTDNITVHGLTKREYFAAMALQGLLANPDYNSPSREMVTVPNTAKTAIAYGDALIEQLNK